MPKVLLVHGYNKKSSDMKPLQVNLGLMGHEGLLVDLPLTFYPIDYGACVLEETLEEIFKTLPVSEKIHLVGHSTGGLVIRSVLADPDIRSRVGRCVLIATPNYGSELADLAAGLSEIFMDLFGTLRSLQCKEVRQLEPLSHLGMEFGAIAGNRNNLALGKLLEGENDGRVTVESVNIEGLKDFIVLPYGHKDIHKQEVTAQLVDRFLRSGRFRDHG